MADQNLQSSAKPVVEDDYTMLEVILWVLGILVGLGVVLSRHRRHGERDGTGGRVPGLGEQRHHRHARQEQRDGHRHETPSE